MRRKKSWIGGGKEEAREEKKGQGMYLARPKYFIQKYSVGPHENLKGI